MRVSSRSRPVRTVALWAVLVVLLSGCRLETATAPVGEAHFTVRFDDVQELSVGHTVRISDVIVGSVVGIELDGYQALVEVSIVDGRPIPVGTSAAISSTSLLGENYVQLRLPTPLPSEALPAGSELPSAGTGASVEELAVQLLALTRAIQGRDVAAVVEAGAVGIGPRGSELGGLLRSVGDLADGVAAQSGAIDALLVDAETLLAALAPQAGAIGATIDSATAASAVLAGQRSRLVTVVEDLTSLAVTLDAEVLAPHRDRLDRIVQNLAPVASGIEAERARLSVILSRVVVATERIPTGIHEGGLLAYAWLHNFTVGGQLIDVAPSEDMGLLDLLLPEEVLPR